MNILDIWVEAGDVVDNDGNTVGKLMKDTTTAGTFRIDMKVPINFTEHTFKAYVVDNLQEPNDTK